jgi:paraquat-inducible protein A
LVDDSPHHHESTILAGKRECQDCGLFQDMPEVGPGDVAYCLRCNAALRRGRTDSLNRAMACLVGALALFVVALQLPIMDVSAVGRSYQATLFTGPSMLDQRGMWEISVVVVATLVVMPAAQLAMLLTVLMGVRAEHPPGWLPGLFGYVEGIRPWSMIEVFLLGSFVAYTRLQAIATVSAGPGLFALGGVMLCLIGADAVLDHEAVWEALEARGLLHIRKPPKTDRLIGCDCCRLVLYAPSGWPCPRCGWKLRQRKRQSLIRSWALLSAATALYVPANLYPIITVIRFGQGEPSTIWQGVVELAQAEMWPLAILVFLASLTVPLLKLVSMTGMLLMTHHGSAGLLLNRTRLFRLVDAVGRWSMIDVFMLTVLVALVHMGFIATVLPGAGAIAFAAVVVLTMFAAAAFDPRLMWDAAAAAGHDVAPAGHVLAHEAEVGEANLRAGDPTGLGSPA